MAVNRKNYRKKWSLIDKNGFSIEKKGIDVTGPVQSPLQWPSCAGPDWAGHAAVAVLRCLGLGAASSVARSQKELEAELILMHRRFHNGRGYGLFGAIPGIAPGAQARSHAWVQARDRPRRRGMERSAAAAPARLAGSQWRRGRTGAGVPCCAAARTRRRGRRVRPPAAALCRGAEWGPGPRRGIGPAGAGGRALPQAVQ